VSASTTEPGSHGTGDPAPRTGASRPLPLEAFACLVEAELGLARGSITPEARLIEDLGLDSLQMLDLLLLIDALGAHLDAEAIARARRFRDVHRMFAERWTLAQHAGLVCESVPTSWTPDPARARPRARGASRFVGSRTRLRAVRATDDPMLYELMQADGGAFLRRRGSGPSPRAFAAELRRGVLEQQIVVDRATDAPIGLVTARDADMRRGIAYLELVLDPQVHGRGWPFEAVMLFIDHLFRSWPLRKLHAEVIGSHVEDIASGLGRFFVEEGCLAAHEYVDGVWVDLHILSLFRERWERDAPRLLRGLVAERADESPAASPRDESPEDVGRSPI